MILRSWVGVGVTRARQKGVGIGETDQILLHKLITAAGEYGDQNNIRQWGFQGELFSLKGQLVTLICPNSTALVCER